MIQTKTVGTVTVLSATEGYLHKIGTESTHPSFPLLPGETVDMYEEVAEKPNVAPYTEEQYGDKINELVRRRYSASAEFAIQRKMQNAMIAFMTDTADAAATAAADKALEEYMAYNAYVEVCKTEAPAAILDDIAQSQDALTPQE